MDFLILIEKSGGLSKGMVYSNTTLSNLLFEDTLRKSSGEFKKKIPFKIPGRSFEELLEEFLQEYLDDFFRDFLRK